MNDYESQNRMILRHLQNGFSITQREASRLYGCDRLSARMNDLREGRYGITPVLWECTMVYSGRKKWGVYSIVKEKVK